MLSHPNGALLCCIGMGLLIMIDSKRRQSEISKIFNFRKELKQITKNPRRKRKDMDSSNSTLIGTKGRRKIYTEDNAKHIFICGTTGSGKTVALANYMNSAIEKDYPLLIVDGKGDQGNGSILDIVQQLNKSGKKKLYVVNLNTPYYSSKYNPFQNASPTVAKDMLINMTDWSEEHYKLNTERYLQKLVILLDMANIPLSFGKILEYMTPDKFLALSATLLKEERITKEEHLLNADIIQSSGKIAQDATARFSTIYESEIGKLFADDGIDIYTALKEKAIILFILNPLIYPELSPVMGRLVLIDSKKAVSKLFTERQRRTFFLFDEINVYAGPTLLDLINKSRSADVTCILATQSLSDLDAVCGEAFKEQVIENCNNYLVLRQNSAVNAEHWASVLGTRQTMDVSYQLQQKGRTTAQTGLGSARNTREFIYHPDDIKKLRTGQGIFMSKEDGYHAKIQIENVI